MDNRWRAKKSKIEGEIMEILSAKLNVLLERGRLLKSDKVCNAHERTKEEKG